jgi:prefoldin subunit 5
MTREEKLSYLKDQAEAIKGQIEKIESGMRDLEKAGK